MTARGAHDPELVLEPEEQALILALRTGRAKVEHLYQAAEKERRAWEATHEPDDFYVALNHEVGGAAYSECVEVMAATALGAFNLAAKALQVTGWQASIAELEFLRRSRHIEGPFGIWDASDLLYPQYDVLGRLAQTLASEDVKRWCGDRAEALLASRGAAAAQSVVEHWRRLVEQRDALPQPSEVSS